jgi:hypothetical protein
LDSPHDLLKAAFAKWIPALGLAWWDIDICYYDDPASILQNFRRDDDRLVLATCDANWIYGTATICINLPAFADRTPEQIERTVVHELCHILVNEMREGELHHEERVVTTLTKAIFWAIAAREAERETA